MNHINNEPSAEYDTTPPETLATLTAADKAVLVQARAILERVARSGDALTSPDAVREWLRHELRPELSEVFGCLFLDNRHRVIAFDRMFFGTIDGATVHPREVMRHALQHNAAAVIFAHNHPSGVADPSRADQAITKRLSEALAYIDVRVLDHIVIGDGPAVSMAERGLM